MEDGALLDFVVAMCETGEAGRYGELKAEQAAERFATDVAQQAQKTVPAAGADFAHVFVYADLRGQGTRREHFRQSAVTLQELLDGLAPDDVRLRDEILDILGETPAASAPDAEDGSGACPDPLRTSP